MASIIRVKRSTGTTAPGSLQFGELGLTIGTGTQANKGERIFDIEGNSQWIDEKMEVPCMTLDTLLDKYKIPHINYLKLDCEGHETNILEAYSWKILPDMIKLEHAHIDDIYMSELLKSHGYLVYVEDCDIYALR